MSLFVTLPFSSYVIYYLKHMFVVTFDLLGFVFHSKTLLHFLNALELSFGTV